MTPPKPAVLYSLLEGVAVQSVLGAVGVEVEVLGRGVNVEEVVVGMMVVVGSDGVSVDVDVVLGIEVVGVTSEVDGVGDGIDGVRLAMDESHGQTVTVLVVVMVVVLRT